MEKFSVKQLTLCGMCAAIVAIGTIVIAIPVPMTNGYINLGDGIILAVAYLFGGIYAALAGAIGSALADILTGYAHWAVFTFIIKGLMGYLAAKIFNKSGKLFSARNFTGVLLAEFIMVFGYFLGGGILQGFAASIQSVPSNMIQAVGAFAVFFALAGALKNIKL